jgi:Ca2+-transporting ATPase
LLSANFGEIGVIAVALFAGFPLPLLPLQILWINLVTDGLPALALGVDTSERGIMHRKPRKVKEGILHNSVGFLIISGIVGTIVTLGMFFLGYYSSDVDTARTLALMTLIMFELFLVFSARSTEKSILEEGLFSNKYLVGAVLLSIGLQFVLIYGLTDWFKLVLLDFSDWWKIFVVSILGVMVVELGKKIFNGKFFN